VNSNPVAFHYVQANTRTRQAWNFHPPSTELATQFDIKYDTRYWGSTSNVHASFPTFSWPVLSELELSATRDLYGC
jgi:hypothetical protein